MKRRFYIILSILTLAANTFAAGADIVGGRISKTTGGYEIQYYITDHLGSTRVITDSNGEIKEQNDYYPFGMRHKNPNLATSTNRWLFSGKEKQTSGEINYMDFGSRMYDDFLGRWFTIDPRAEDYYPLSPYAYCGNNPVIYVDENGEFLHLIVGAIIGGAINWAMNGFQFNAKGLGHFGVGALAGALGAGVGAGISSSLAGGSFGAGFWGTSSALTATSSFISGAAIGGGAGLSSGFVTGFGNGLVNGQSFGKALAQGGLYSLMAGASGAIIGGVWGGIDAVRDGRRFWDGAIVTKETLVNQNIPVVGQIGDNNCLPANAEAIDRSFGGNITQQNIRDFPGLGGDPNTVGLGDVDVWNAYKELSGHSWMGEPGSPAAVRRILNPMQGGARVSINLNTGGKIGHSVVMQSIVQKTVTKVNGNIVQKLLYYVMNPANGGNIHKMSGKVLSNAFNIFYIHP
jgi:RHS repeat-associated protein